MVLSTAAVDLLRPAAAKVYFMVADCSKIEYTQFIFNMHILYSVHTFYIQYTLRIFNKPILYSIFTEIYIQYLRKNIQ
jgi:hypothetical protein